MGDDHDKDSVRFHGIDEAEGETVQKDPPELSTNSETE